MVLQQTLHLPQTKQTRFGQPVPLPQGLVAQQRFPYKQGRREQESIETIYEDSCKSFIVEEEWNRRVMKEHRYSNRVSLDPRRYMLLRSLHCHPSPGTYKFGTHS